MLINYKKDRAGILNIPEPKSKEQIEREKKTPEKVLHGSPKVHSLVPGVNDIDDKIWNRIKNTETIQRYLKSGDLILINAEEVENKKDPKLPTKDMTIKEFKELSSEEQTAIMRETYNVKLLKKWKKSVREGAAAYLNERIDRLENPQKYSDDQDDME